MTLHISSKLFKLTVQIYQFRTYTSCVFTRNKFANSILRPSLRISFPVGRMGDFTLHLLGNIQTYNTIRASVQCMTGSWNELRTEDTYLFSLFYKGVPRGHLLGV